jgi:selenide,water dikinase
MAAKLVLLGAGHAHVEVLRAFALRPSGNASLTVVSPYTHVPYTGMIPGVVAGRYSLADASIDAAALAARAGAAFLKTQAVRVDLARKTVLCGDGAEISYDVLSINIGAVARNPLQAADSARILATKPVEPFIAAIDLTAPGRVAVIGGGHGGVELAAALGRRGAGVFLLAGRAGLAPSARPPARAMLARRLAARGVAVIDGADAVSADARAVTLDDGRAVAADTVILAAGVAPPPLIATLDLPKDGAGFLRALPSLQSAGDPSIFAAGDCAAIERLPKAGVYAVREGPVLAANLAAALAGAPLQDFRPQADYLSILSFWPDGAVAVRGSLAAEGRWADRWKEAIDRRFIARYRAAQKGGNRFFAKAARPPTS